MKICSVPHGVHTDRDAVEDLLTVKAFCQHVLAGDPIHEGDDDCALPHRGLHHVDHCRQRGALNCNDHQIRGSFHILDILQRKCEWLVIDRIPVILMAGEAGAVHHKLDTLRPILFLKA